MGEAARPQEHLLILLPASVPDAVIDDLRRSFPNIEITHLQIGLDETVDSVPSGMAGEIGIGTGCCLDEQLADALQ